MCDFPKEETQSKQFTILFNSRLLIFGQFRIYRNIVRWYREFAYSPHLVSSIHRHIY